METRNLLKEFYEERLEKSFDIKFETLSEPVKREIEKMHMFHIWKFNMAFHDFAKIIRTVVLSAEEWQRQTKQLYKKIKPKNKLIGQ